MADNRRRLIFAKAILLPVLCVVLIQALLTLITISVFDQSCLYKPWYLALKNPAFYLVFGNLTFSLSVCFLRSKLANILGLLDYKGTISKSLFLLGIIGYLAYFYFAFYYANFGYGACSQSNINVNYYNYSGQEKYLK